MNLSSSITRRYAPRRNQSSLVRRQNLRLNRRIVNLAALHFRCGRTALERPTKKVVIAISPLGSKTVVVRLDVQLKKSAANYEEPNSGICRRLGNAGTDKCRPGAGKESEWIRMVSRESLSGTSGHPHNRPSGQGGSKATRRAPKKTLQSPGFSSALSCPKKSASQDGICHGNGWIHDSNHFRHRSQSFPPAPPLT